MQSSNKQAPGLTFSTLDGYEPAGSSQVMKLTGTGRVPPARTPKQTQLKAKRAGDVTLLPTKADMESLAALRDERSLNLRQLILRTHRALNRRIAEKLVERGYAEIKPTHITIYSNIDLEGTRISTLAERANITVQGMGQLTAELEHLGYLCRDEDPTDGRAKVVTFTAKGWALMLASFEVLREIEAEVQARLKPGDLDTLRRILSRMFEEN